MFDLRRLGKVDHLSMVGTNGSKYPAIRKHLDENIGQVYKDMDTSYVDSNVCFNLIILIFFYEYRFMAYPEEGKTDPEACTCCRDLFSLFTSNVWCRQGCGSMLLKQETLSLSSLLIVKELFSAPFEYTNARTRYSPSHFSLCARAWNPCASNQTGDAKTFASHRTHRGGQEE